MTVHHILKYIGLNSRSSATETKSLVREKTLGKYLLFPNGCALIVHGSLERSEAARDMAWNHESRSQSIKKNFLINRIPNAFR